MGQLSFKNKSYHSSFHECFMKDVVYFEHVSFASGGCAQVPAPGHHGVETQDCCAYPPQGWHVTTSPSQDFCTHAKMASAGFTLPLDTHLLLPTIITTSCIANSIKDYDIED